MKDETVAKILKVALVVGGVCALAPLGFVTGVNAQGIGVTELEKMLVATPQSVERGEQLYEQNCATCHGADGTGKTGVELADVPGQTFQTTNFAANEYKYTGGPIQVYNSITYGLEEAVVGEQPAGEQPAGEEAVGVPPHPKYKFLQYQSRWDIVHYVRSLGSDASAEAGQLTDPPQIIARARERAEKGVCEEDIRQTIADKVAPKGEEQIQAGAELFAQQCVSCHGEQGKGDGPAAGALQPPPRNFVGAAVEDWTNSPSALGVFNTLQVGIEGTSMASYANLPEEDLWALTHYVLSVVPDDIEIESGEQQIVEACRALSAPEKPAPVSVDVAMQALVKDQGEERYIRLSEYGPVRLDPKGDSQSGQELYVQNCVSCHGVAGSGRRKGPYGAQPPYLYLEVERLIPAMAGGTAEQFAQRSYSGVHATLPSMSSAALLSKDEWADLQAYVATFEGQGEITVESPQAPTAPAEGGAPQEGAEQPAPPQGDAPQGQQPQGDQQPQGAPAQQPQGDAPAPEQPDANQPDANQ